MCGLRIQRPSAIADLLCLRHRRETDQAGLAGVSVRGVAVAGGDRLSYLPESPLSSQIHARFAFAVCDPLAVHRWPGHGPDVRRCRVKAVLSSYKVALEALDLTGVERLFATDNQVVESGKV